MIDPVQLHLETIERVRTSLATLAREPAKRAYIPINYRSYLRAASGYGVRVSSEVESYAAELAQFEPINVLEALLDFIESQEFPSLFASCSADDVDVVAIPLLLGRNDLAKRYLEGFLLKCSPHRVWASYLEGLGALVRGAYFTPKLPTKPSGMEKHWVLYVQLMSALANGEAELSSITDAIELSFRRCNGDKRLVNTTHIDPNGTHPVPWDLRLAYVLAAAGLGPNNSSKPTPLRGAA
jgi:hypothetical protein